MTMGTFKVEDEKIACIRCKEEMAEGTEYVVSSGFPMHKKPCNIVRDKEKEKIILKKGLK